jgi:hypothetical protein
VASFSLEFAVKEVSKLARREKAREPSGDRHQPNDGKYSSVSASGFFEITASSRQCSALRVYASNLVDVRKIPLAAFFDDRGGWVLHGGGVIKT